MIESHAHYLNGVAAWIYARTQFGVMDIHVPDCPDILEERLMQISDWVFSTRPLPGDLYAIERWLAELAAGDRERYLAFGVSGHGVQSWAFHWYDVGDALAIFVQLPWGGAYGNPDEDAKRLDAAFSRVAELRIAAASVRTAGTIPEGCRFVLVDGLDALRVGWTGCTGRNAVPGGRTLWRIGQGYGQALESLRAGPDRFEDHIP